MTIIVQKCYSNITKLVKATKLDFKGCIKQSRQKAGFTSGMVCLNKLADIR
jgi:hypothetical protein